MSRTYEGRVSVKFRAVFGSNWVDFSVSHVYFRWVWGAGSSRYNIDQVLIRVVVSKFGDVDMSGQGEDTMICSEVCHQYPEA